MKKAPFFALLAALAVAAAWSFATPPVADPAHNSQNALDWAGTYRGTIPCADCEGIETAVTLDAGGGYRMLSRYRGKSDEIFADSGMFTWNDAGSVVTLARGARFQVGENHLRMLDTAGNPIEGALAENYLLQKDTGTAALTETYWKLVTLGGKPVTGLARDAYIILKRHDGRVTGAGGCNHLTGGYTADESEGTLNFSKAASTMMACATGMDVEAAFHDALGKTARYAIDGERLYLQDATGAPLAVLEAVYLR